MCSTNVRSVVSVPSVRLKPWPPGSGTDSASIATWVRSSTWMMFRSLLPSPRTRTVGARARRAAGGVHEAGTQDHHVEIASVDEPLHHPFAVHLRVAVDIPAVVVGGQLVSSGRLAQADTT